MSFSATQLFVEIFVVGVLLVSAFSPIIIAYSPRAMARKGVLPIGDLIELKPVVLLLAVALLYSVGIAGNRLLERAYTCLPVGSVDEGMYSDELPVRDHSEIAREWVERHKTYLKVSRAASFSSLAFLGSMLWYQYYYIVWGSGRRYSHRRRYTRKHYVVALLFGFICSLAYLSEGAHYRKHLSEYHQLIKQPPDYLKRL